MSISNSPRFINTPTLLEEYHEDQKGYDQAVSEDLAVALSREYDRVDGNEEFYKAIFSHMTLPSVAVVSGNEGFFEGIKKAIDVVIQAVKDFFKWLFTFFTGKKEVVTRKAETLALDIDKHGVNTDEIPYPRDYTDIYDKPTKPDAGLAWMSRAMADCETAMNHVGMYIGVLQAASNSLTADNLVLGKDAGANFKAANKKILDATKTALNIKAFNESTVFFGLNDFKMDESGKLHELPSPPNPAKDPKFRTDQSEVLGLMKKHKALVEKADDMMKHSVKLEKEFIKTLNRELELSKKAAGKDTPYTSTVGEVQTILRNAMANLKLMEVMIFRAVFASLSILKATVKKG